MIAEKPCKYGCGKTIMYDPTIGKPPFREVDTQTHHTYKRCAELLKEQGKEVRF